MNQKNMFSFLKNTRSLVYISLLISLYAVLSLIAIYITPQLRFNLTFFPVAWASAMLGPVAGGITGAIGDVLGWVIRPTAPFFPGFTISAFFSGLIYGIFLYKKEVTLLRVFFAAVTMLLIVELGLNTLWLSILFGHAFQVLIVGRIFKALLLLPIQMVVLYSTSHVLKRISRADA